MRALSIGREPTPQSGCLQGSLSRAQSEPQMTDRSAGYRYRSDVVIIPRIRVTFALSVLIHIAALWILLPRLPLLRPGEARDQASDRLQVELQALPQPEPSQPIPPASPPQRETRAILTARARPRNAPPRETPPEFVVPSAERPEIPEPAPPSPPAVVEPPKSFPPVAGDMASYVEARRRERGEPTASSEESETERRARIVASNLPVTQSPMSGQPKKRGGGVFEITRMAYDDAEFRFFGWHSEAGRKLPKVYEVRLGNNGDMRTAIVRRMIALIRETEQGDFSWDSFRLGRIVTLSARPADTAGLEEFMLSEFFDSPSGTSRR